MHIDFALPIDGDLAAGFENYKRKAARSIMDYGFHMAITQWNDKVAFSLKFHIAVQAFLDKLVQAHCVRLYVHQSGGWVLLANNPLALDPWHFQCLDG
jgi:dihydroorotase-like cyclic amidohydrolase